MNVQAGSSADRLRELIRQPKQNTDTSTTSGGATAQATLPPPPGLDVNDSFRARMLQILGTSASAEVDEEELFAGLIQERLNQEDEEAAAFYASEKARLMTSMARSDGYIPLEDVAKEALKSVVASGMMEQGKAERVHAQAFALAQLDDNTEMLFDDRGSEEDPTIAKAAFDVAFESLNSKLEQIESGDLDLGVRPLDIPSNKVGDSAPPADETDEPETPDPVVSGSEDIVGVQSLDGPEGFLWKPESERDGNLAVLLPNNLAELIERLELHAKNPPDETSKLDEGRFSGNTNGNRPTFRFDKSGAEYGENVYVVAYRKDGEKVIWEIGNGAERND